MNTILKCVAIAIENVDEQCADVGKKIAIDERRCDIVI